MDSASDATGGGTRLADDRRHDLDEIQPGDAMNVERARELIGVARALGQEWVDVMTELWDERAWLTLGYESWKAMCDVELRPHVLTRGDRAQITAQLQQAGMSNRAIADALDVSPQTVQASGAQNRAPDRKVKGRDGKDQPPVKGKPHEIARRRAHVRELADAGYTRNAIRLALGCAAGTVDTDCAALGIALSERTVPLIASTPDERSWRDAPRPRRPIPEMPDEPEPRPRLTTPGYLGPRSIGAEIRRVRELYDVDRWALLACHDADEAEAAGDHAWVARTAVEIAQLADDLRRLVLALEDRTFRLAQSRTDGSAPDDVAPRLRSVP